jgi:hypothetical protein
LAEPISKARIASAHAAIDHIHHEQAYIELESLIRAVEVAVNSRRCIAGRALYKRYAVFAAADMQHMHEEETELLSALHRVFSDDELKAIEERIVTAISPDKMKQYLRLMAPAMNHGERVAFLAKLQAGMPPAAFETILADAVQPTLEQNDYSAVVAALGGRRAA